MPRLQLGTTGSKNRPPNRSGTAKTVKSFTVKGKSGATLKTTLPLGDDTIIVTLWFFLTDNDHARTAWHVVQRDFGGQFRATRELVELVGADDVPTKVTRIQFTAPEGVVYAVEAKLRLWTRPVLLRVEYSPCPVPGWTTKLEPYRPNGPDHRPEDRFLNRIAEIDGDQADRFGRYGPRGIHPPPIGRSGLSEKR